MSELINSGNSGLKTPRDLKLTTKSCVWTLRFHDSYPAGHTLHILVRTYKPLGSVLKVYSENSLNRHGSHLVRGPLGGEE